MADPAATPAQFYAVLATTGLPARLVALLRVHEMAVERGFAPLGEAIYRLVSAMQSDLNRVAVEIAGLADGLIIEKIHETAARNRPQAGEMDTHIASRPGSMGQVGIGSIDELEKIVNPAGFGPFWRAQEYGTGHDGVPSQIGRELYGTFEPSGTPPASAQRGLRVGTDAAFFPGGSNPGQGIISVDLPGRHFLRDGATEAADRWRARMAGLDEKYANEVKRLQHDLGLLARGGRRVTRYTVSS